MKTKVSNQSRMRTAIAVVFALAFFGCRKPAAEKSAVCIADSIPRLERARTIPVCAAGDWVCRAKCFAGNARSCVALAYEAEKDTATAAEAVRLYKRACLLGEANACTNYAATMWASDSKDAQVDCARRIFAKACAAKEPFACGMVGRLMLESTKEPRFAEARKYLEKACDEVNGFPCRVLAKHLESGKIGAYKPESIRSLLARACAAGDPDACGDPKTAEETFH